MHIPRIASCPGGGRAVTSRVRTPLLVAVAVVVVVVVVSYVVVVVVIHDRLRLPTHARSTDSFTVCNCLKPFAFSAVASPLTYSVPP